jgi:hypothetical protein
MFPYRGPALRGRRPQASTSALGAQWQTKGSKELSLPIGHAGRQNASEQAEKHLGVQACAFCRGQQGIRLREALGRPAGAPLRSLYQRRYITPTRSTASACRIARSSDFPVICKYRVASWLRADRTSPALRTRSGLAPIASSTGGQ